MNRFIALLFAIVPAFGAMAQDRQELTTSEAKTLYKTTTKKWTSVHDPSVVWEPSTKRYYIFGSHRAQAWTTDLQNWTWFTSPWRVGSNQNAGNDVAFVTPAVKTVKKGGQDVDFPQFNAMEWAARTDDAYNINGNMWAPDVLYNPVMKKWCQYLSINGDKWHSSIILLTADKIEGPYTYQGPVVISGFYDTQHSWKDTDLEIVLGTQSTLPARYNTTKWGNRYPNNIDPCVFYDEDGKLWMAYGSWSGGIWMLELDETTGLRDYDVTYTLVGSGDDITTDPYFGKKIAGGHYVSGEGAYIEHIGDYYYLFMSYGGLEQKGGYEMRVFRSKNPDGPYTSGSGSAIFTSYVLNFGPNAAARGEKLMGPYSHWGYMSQGERSQGHNSIIAAPDGRTYLVYHTRFCNDANKADEGHQVRVHQVFQNQKGWLVAAPFEYNGETVTDSLLATTQPFTVDELTGTYDMLIHKFANDHKNLEQVMPSKITLHANGTVTGSKTGTWGMEEGTGYVTLVLSGVTYNGVVFEETMDNRNMHAVAITAAANSGVNMWAYKLHPKYELAWHVNNQTVPVTANQTVSRDIDLYAMSLGLDNTSLEWTSSEPAVVSNYGKYNPSGLSDNLPLSLTALLTSGNYYWQQQYDVKAAAESVPTADWQTGMVAHYGFDNDALANTFNTAQTASLLRNSTTAKPALHDGDPLRTGSYVQLAFGANGKESYVEMPNPLYGIDLSQGVTLSFWVRRTDNNLWDALFGLQNGNARLFMTGNLYTGFNDGAGHWLDINHPNTIETGTLGVGHWQLVTVVITPTATSSSGGVTVYVNGTVKRNDRYNGEIDGKAVTTRQGFDYKLMLQLISQCPTLCLGKGSFWGSPDACFDDVIVYSRPLSLTQVMALRDMENRVFDFRTIPTGIHPSSVACSSSPSTVYDLQGRRVTSPLQPGVYLINGKKVVKK